MRTFSANKNPILKLCFDIWDFYFHILMKVNGLISLIQKRATSANRIPMTPFHCVIWSFYFLFLMKVNGLISLIQKRATSANRIPIALLRCAIGVFCLVPLMKVNFQRVPNKKPSASSMHRDSIRCGSYWIRTSDFYPVKVTL